jgi:hypothetical protein
MNPAESNALHVIHLLSLVGMVGTIFYACAGAPETRKRALMWSGIAAVLVLLTGVRMSFALYQGMPGWVWVKAVCWLGLAGLVGPAYKRRDKAGMWIVVTLVLSAVALWMVYGKPF